MSGRKRISKLPRDVRTLPVVRVTWVDSCSNHRWREMAEARADVPMECQSVGFLVANSARAVVLIQSVNESGHAGASWIIPKSCVRRVEKLRG